MVSTSTYPAEELERIARRIPEGIATAGDLDLIDEVVAADYVEHGPMAAVEGREALRTNFEALLAAFEDFSATIDGAVTAGDVVALRVTLRGTYAGEFMGIEPTGKASEFLNLVWNRMADGQVAEGWVVPDMLTFFAQLGREEVRIPTLT